MPDEVFDLDAELKKKPFDLDAAQAPPSFATLVRNVNPIVRSAADVGTGAGKAILDLIARAAAMQAEGERAASAPSGVPPMNLREAGARASKELGMGPAPDETLSTQIGRFAGEAAPQVAVGMATGGMSLPAQMALGGGAMALQTGIEGGTPNEIATGGALGAGAPVAAKAIGGILKALPEHLRDRAAMQLTRLLGLDPGEALKFITPEGVADLGIVERASKTIGVGTGRTLAKRATEAARAAADELGAVKGRIVQRGETLPIELLDELENVVRSRPVRLSLPAVPQNPLPKLKQQPTFQAPESMNPTELSSFDRVANDIKALAARWRASGATRIPAAEVMKLRTQWGDVASDVFNTLQPSAERASARAAGTAYAPTTKALHEEFPELAKVDLTFHESKLLADALRSEVMKGVTAQGAGPAAVALKAAAGAPFLAVSEQTAGKGLGEAFTNLPKSFGALYVAMQVIKSPLWRSSGVAGRLALANAIEQGALSTAARMGTYAAAQQAATPEEETP